MFGSHFGCFEAEVLGCIQLALQTVGKAGWFNHGPAEADTDIVTICVMQRPQWAGPVHAA